MATTATKQGSDWIINGEKWFTSDASISQLALVMAKTDPKAARHCQYSTFLVELPAAGFNIVYDVPVLGASDAANFNGETTMGTVGFGLLG